MTPVLTKAFKGLQVCWSKKNMQGVVKSMGAQALFSKLDDVDINIEPLAATIIKAGLFPA